MLLEGIDWKRPDRTWQPLMAVKTRLDTRSVTEGETRFQPDEKSACRTPAKQSRPEILVSGLPVLRPSGSDL